MLRFLLFVLALLVPLSVQSEEIVTMRQGYKITPYAKHSGSNLTFEGRCEQGPSCTMLQLIGCMENNDDGRYCLSAEVENAGTAGRLFESDPVQVSPNKNGWRVVSVSAVCVTP